jgi:hypothetical protein
MVRAMFQTLINVSTDHNRPTKTILPHIPLPLILTESSIQIRLLHLKRWSISVRPLSFGAGKQVFGLLSNYRVTTSIHINSVSAASVSVFSGIDCHVFSSIIVGHVTIIHSSPKTMLMSCSLTAWWPCATASSKSESVWPMELSWFRKLFRRRHSIRQAEKVTVLWLELSGCIQDTIGTRCPSSFSTHKPCVPT